MVLVGLSITGFLPIFRTFLGDFNHQQLPLTRLQTLWEQKNRVLLKEFTQQIPLFVEKLQKLPLTSLQTPRE